MPPKLFSRTEDAWRAMYADISRSRSSIMLEMYIFNKNGAPYDFTDLLVRKAQAGVPVTVIVDAWGSGEVPRVTVEKLRKGGVTVLTFYSWFRRLHRKLLIVDGRIAYVGGVNLYRSSKSWADLSLRLEGHIVKTFVRSFHRLEQQLDPDHHPAADALEDLENLAPIRKFRMWVVEHVAERNSIRATYRRMIAEAKHEIIIVTPYFMPRRSFLRLLEEAHARGVTITILVPKHTDVAVADRINHRYLRLLQGSGITFFLYPHMNHGKAMIVDRREGVLGSQNFDYLSLEVNAEIGIVFSDARLVREVMIQVDRWLLESEAYDPMRARRRWLDWFLFPFIALFRMF
jgi:cardiolipin synthase